MNYVPHCPAPTCELGVGHIGEHYGEMFNSNTYLSCGQAGPAGYMCTLKDHHSGKHQAYGTSGSPIEEWWTGELQD